MSGPVRIQLSRKKGWRMPPNTVKVDRSTNWGNPVKVGPGCTAQQAVDVFRRAIEDNNRSFLLCFEPRDVPRKLRGKNLACWCPLDQPCHADVLLELANREPAP